MLFLRLQRKERLEMSPCSASTSVYKPLQKCTNAEHPLDLLLRGCIVDANQQSRIRMRPALGCGNPPFNQELGLSHLLNRKANKMG